jgi:hypothetical protein
LSVREHLRAGRIDVIRFIKHDRFRKCASPRSYIGDLLSPELRLCIGSEDIYPPWKLAGIFHLKRLTLFQRELDSPSVQ